MVAQESAWSRLFGRKSPSRALTASGSPIVEPRRRRGQPVRSNPTGTLDPSAPDAIRARSQEWQKRILEYSESVPEVAGASALVRASLSSVNWVVEGTAAAGMKARAQTRIDQLDKDRAGELIWLSGETFIAWPTDPGPEVPVEDVPQPYSLSVAEINMHSDPPSTKGPNGEQVDQTDPVMRVWRPSKSNRWQASSPNKAAMDLLDAMYLSQLADTAVHRSRLAGAGIVFWPTNAPDIPVVAGEEPVAGSRQAMLQAFEHAAWSAIDKQNSRQATIPFVVMYDPAGPGGTTLYKPEMFRIERDDQADQYATRAETYRTRYATAVELPLEAVTGMGATNHWSAWQIDVDKWRTWLKPICELLRVELEARIVKQYGENLTLRCDATDLISKPDQTDTIVKLIQLEVVTPESGKLALISGDIEDLVMKDPPPRTYTSNVAPGQPSDFGKGDTDRGGGKFRDQP
jgi:hypothetical protein